MCRIYKTLVVLCICMHTFLFSMHFDWLLLKLKNKPKPSPEQIKGIRFTYKKPHITHQHKSFFEIICCESLDDIIAQEVEDEKILDNNFVPRKPLEVLKDIKLPKNIKKILKTYGKQFEWKFNSYYRKYKNVRGAWDLFITNVVEMEDMYEK